MPFFDTKGRLIINNPQWIKAEPRPRKQTILTEAHRLHMGEPSWVVTIRPSSKSLDRDEKQLREDFEPGWQFSEYDLIEPNFYVVYVRAKTTTTAKKLAWDKVRNMPMGIGIRKQDVYIHARPAHRDEESMERVFVLNHNSQRYRNYLYRL